MNKKFILKKWMKEWIKHKIKTQNQMNYAMDKLSTLLQTKNKGEIKCFITLLCISIILFLILIL